MRPIPSWQDPNDMMPAPPGDEETGSGCIWPALIAAFLFVVVLTLLVVRWLTLH